MQNSIPALAPRQLFEPKLALVPLNAISCRAPSFPPPRRTISRRSPCGNYSSPNSPSSRVQQFPATSPYPPAPRAEQSPGARPAAARRALTPHSPAHNNILPPPPPLLPHAEPSPGARPAVGLRARIRPSPAQTNLLPPPHPPSVTQNSLPALALRQFFEPELPPPPPRTISRRPLPHAEQSPGAGPAAALRA